MHLSTTHGKLPRIKIAYIQIYMSDCNDRLEFTRNVKYLYEKHL